MSEKLKPCPFCGGEAVIHSAYGSNTNAVLYYPRCKDETCLGHNVWQNYRTKQSAIKAWNRRPK